MGRGRRALLGSDLDSSEYDGSEDDASYRTPGAEGGADDSFAAARAGAAANDDDGVRRREEEDRVVVRGELDPRWLEDSAAA